MNRSFEYMSKGTKQPPQEPETTMPQFIMSASDPRLEAVLSTPAVRPEAVARARELLATPSWCRAEEVASHLVDCLVGHQIP